MLVPLARRTLLHDWRRFLPAALAIAFSGLLVLVQVALLVGLFATISLYITASTGDLWVGFPGTQTIDSGRPIRAGVEVFLHRHPAVARVERLQWSGGDWRAPKGDRGGVSVILTGIDTRADGSVLARAVTPAQRRLLMEPGSILVDAADLDKLGVAIGDSAEIGGHRVRVVGVTEGLRAIGGVNVIASLGTASRLNGQGESDDVAYFVVSLTPGADAEAVRRDLRRMAAGRQFDVWTAQEFADQTLSYWIFESGMGVSVAFGSAVALLVGVVITSQTLSAAIAGSIREYATLRALGVSAGDLRRIVVTQSLWLAFGGLLLAGVLSGLLLLAARAYRVPARVDGGILLAAVAVVLTVALSSGLFALRQLRRADPIMLLR
jgi:putative ABC transport system permease protein